MQTKAVDETPETVTITEAFHNPAKSAAGLPFLARNAPQRQKREVSGDRREIVQEAAIGGKGLVH
jgi:hypothetical protein